MCRLEGKIAPVTGGNSGIGLATANRFVNEGAEPHLLVGGRLPPADSFDKWLWFVEAHLQGER